MHRSLAGTALLVSLMLAEASLAYPALALDGRETQALQTAEGGLKQAETNLKLSTDAAGPGDAALSGSKARLVQTRLEMARAPLAQVAELLASLPSKDGQVSALRQRHDALAAGVAALDARLGKKPETAAQAAPALAPAAAPAANSLPAGPARLDYKQEQLAKDARFYLDEMEGLSNGVAEVVQTIKQTKDVSSLDHRKVQAAINSLDKGRQRGTLVKGNLDQLPPGGAGVAELAARYKALLAAFDAASAVVAPAHDKLGKLVSPGSYPELESDLKRLQQLGGQLGDVQVLDRRDERAALIVEQLAPARAEAQRFSKTYAPLVAHETPEGARAKSMSEFFAQNEKAFSDACSKLRSELPKEIDADLAAVDRMADDAVKGQKMAFFSNGIPDAIARVEGKLRLLGALDAAKVKAARAAIDKTQAAMKARASALREAIIADNELPPNRYGGGDRGKLEKLAADAWKKMEPKAQVLTLRIPSPKWERDAYVRYENGAWHVVDQSRLQVSVIVKSDDKVAVIRPVNLTIDHVSRDALSASPMDTPSETLAPHRYVLLSKVK